MFIQTESTPNPATLKFLPGQTVLKTGTMDFPSSATSDKSPLARGIFAVDGVSGVFLGTDFITVTKAETVDWDHIKPAILGAVLSFSLAPSPQNNLAELGLGPGCNLLIPVRKKLKTIPESNDEDSDVRMFHVRSCMILIQLSCFDAVVYVPCLICS